MRRHLLRPDAHQEPQEPLVWARHRRCEHGGSAPCAWPRCWAGVEGERRAVAGPRQVTYLRRQLVLDIQHGRLVETWSWVVDEVVNLVDAGRST